MNNNDDCEYMDDGTMTDNLPMDDDNLETVIKVYKNVNKRTHDDLITNNEHPMDTCDTMSNNNNLNADDAYRRHGASASANSSANNFNDCLPFFKICSILKKNKIVYELAQIEHCDIFKNDNLGENSSKIINSSTGTTDGKTSSYSHSVIM